MKMRETWEEAGLTEADIQYKLVYLVGIWIEAALYGGYLCLFAAAFPILLRHSKRMMFSSTVFLIGNFFMFLLISLHSGLTVFQSVVAFAYQTDIYGPIRIVNDMGYWASYTSPIIGATIFMTGDILVIYSQYRRTRDAGLVAVHVPNLLLIIRIIVESAVIYTAGMLVMVVLLATDHPARLVAHLLMIPVTGIVCVLMALRTHILHEESKRTPASPSLLPDCLFDEPSTIDSRTEPAADEGQPPLGLPPSDQHQPTSPPLEAL
ncbi:hypothetical protein BKA70DRAFT_1497113 [Coprinopsis sp. MPI-PUGE-AT-0042]|nr:hypothetical protein BKA70DRAFT_1497113 [Coprinopsis sp. MPI-PUGE-AT-0042]